MSSGKSAGGASSNNYYGHCAGVVCQGQLDFVWGLLINNNLAWPDASLWDSNIYKAGTMFIYTDGNVYQTGIDTQTDPDIPPWTLLAIPWTAGTYHSGDKVIYMGSVWEAVATTSSAPESSAPSKHPIGVQLPFASLGWKYRGTPEAWSAATPFWGVNSIVVYNGYIYKAGADTKAVPPNAPWIRWKVDRASNPLKLTVTNMGDAYLYWGLPNQVLDTVNEQVLSELGHPPYRNKAVLVLHNFLFGQGTQSPPNIQLLGGRCPVQSLITGASVALDADWQANPWVVLAELLTSQTIGLGLPLSFFYAEAWQAEADRCAANPSLYYISPLYDSLMKIREVVSDLMQYPDAFVFWSTIGALSAGHWPHGENVAGKPTIITRDDMTEEFEWDSNLWGDTANSVQVNFQDESAGFNSRPVFANNLFNARAIQQLQTKSVDRPHITRYAQAAAWAAEFAKLAGDQQIKSQSLTIRAERATDVVPGSIFEITDDVLGITTVQRCTAQTISALPEGTRKITHETERGVAHLPYAPTATNSIAAAGDSPNRISNYAVCQLPSALAPSSTLSIFCGRSSVITTTVDFYFKSLDAASYQLLGSTKSFGVAGVLDSAANTNDTVGSNLTLQTVSFGAVTNGDTYTVGDTSWWSSSVEYADDAGFTSGLTVAIDGTDYIDDPIAGTVQILSAGSISTGKYVRIKFYNTLAVNYDSTAPQGDLDLILSSLTADEIADGEVLLFAFQNSNPAIYEVMSIRSVQAVGNGTSGVPTWFVKVVRSMFGTYLGGDGSHVWGSDSNDVVFMLKKDSIIPLSQEYFDVLKNSEGKMSLRLVPSSAWVYGDINDVYDPANNPAGLTTAFNYTWADTFNPTGIFGITQKNGVAIADFTAAFLTTDVFLFAFSMADPNSDLVHAVLVATQGQQEQTLWTSNYQPTGNVNATVNFSLPVGSWQIYLRMLDVAGNQSQLPLVIGGNIVTMSVSVPAAPASAPAPIANILASGLHISLSFGIYTLAQETGLTIYYQIQNRNVAPGSSWHTAVAVLVGGSYQFFENSSRSPIIVSKSTQTLYAYSAKSGLANSAVGIFNY